jgi:hypothetical protein
VAELIQGGGEMLRSEPHKLINSILIKEVLPDHRKESIIVAIYKDGDIKLAIVIISDITVINFIQNFIQYPSLKVKSINRRSYCESSVWVST